VIPEGDSIVVPKNLAREEIPDFSWRRIWNRPKPLDVALKTGGRSTAPNHTHYDIVPPDEYFEDNPEYFAKFKDNGYNTWDTAKRRAQGYGGQGQLELSNETVQDLAIEWSRDYADDRPRRKAVALGANDNAGWSISEEALEFGSTPSDQMFRFQNIVAEELSETHPNTWTAFHAYWDVWTPPEDDLTAHPNVICMFLNQACQAHAVDDESCPINAEYIENFHGWKDTGVRMGVREWYIPFFGDDRWEDLPWVQTDVLKRNVDFWQDNGVKRANVEMRQRGKFWPLQWPLVYCLAKMLWNADNHPSDLLDDACAKLFGDDAGESMSEYYHLLADAMENVDEHADIWNLPDPTEIYHKAVILDAREKLCKAYKQTSDGTVERERIEEEIEVWENAEETLSGGIYGLTPNINEGETIDTDVEYEADPAFDNPSDPGRWGPALLDGNPYGTNWANVVGFNEGNSPTTVTFDFKDSYGFTRFALQFGQGGKKKMPNEVTFRVRTEDGETTSVGTIEPEETGWHELAVGDPGVGVEGQYVEMEVAGDGQTVLNEFKAWGRDADIVPLL